MVFSDTFTIWVVVNAFNVQCSVVLLQHISVGYFQAEEQKGFWFEVRAGHIGTIVAIPLTKKIQLC